MVVAGMSVVEINCGYTVDKVHFVLVDGVTVHAFVVFPLVFGMCIAVSSLSTSSKNCGIRPIIFWSFHCRARGGSHAPSCTVKVLVL